MSINISPVSPISLYILEKTRGYTHILPLYRSVFLSQSVICCVGMCSSVPLADSEAEWGEGSRRDLLCGRPELQRLRRVLTLQDQ